jgi:hypothetical protein
MLRVSIGNIDRRQRKIPVVVWRKNFHIDSARVGFGRFTHWKDYSYGCCEEEGREEDRCEEACEEEEEVTDRIL